MALSDFLKVSIWQGLASIDPVLAPLFWAGRQGVVMSSGQPLYIFLLYQWVLDSASGYNVLHLKFPDVWVIGGPGEYMYWRCWMEQQKFRAPGNARSRTSWQPSKSALSALFHGQRSDGCLLISQQISSAKTFIPKSHRVQRGWFEMVPISGFLGHENNDVGSSFFRVRARCISLWKPTKSPRLGRMVQQAYPIPNADWIQPAIADAVAHRKLLRPPF